MKKDDIYSELISKIEIKVEDTLFYMPGEMIKGKIIINPKYKVKEKIFHLTLKIIQYEFWEYNNIEIEELKNIYKTIIQEENIEYKLNELELSAKKSSDSFENFSIIEKEEENKIISIPFHLKINTDKILPTFQFQNKDYILGIRHLLIVECKESESSNYTGLFIGKNKNIELCKPKQIKENYIVGLGSLEIIVDYPKLSYTSDEEINLNIKTNANLHFKKVTKITQTFYRKIDWVGYLKNSNLDKTLYDIRINEYNKDQYDLLTRLTIPIKPLIESFNYASMTGSFGLTMASGAISDIKKGLPLIGDPGYEYGESKNDLLSSAIVGGLTVSVGFIWGFIKGVIDQGNITKDCLNLNENQNNMESEFKGKIDIVEKQKSLIIDELKKFVFFKDNKVVGFIKFEKNITPPVNGYYFNCEFNMKIEVDITGIILNRNKYLKTQIDFYDSEEYIANMKSIFKTN